MVMSNHRIRDFIKESRGLAAQPYSQSIKLEKRTGK